MLDLNTAVTRLKSNDVIAFPTETVYGLGARIGSEAAIQKIFSTKERPFFDPLIVHVSSIQQAQSCFLMWNDIADTLAKHFWPGPLTLVMKKNNAILDLITSGLENVGVRIPAHPLARLLIEQVGEPIAAPSANKFGKTSPTKAEHVISEFGENVGVLDGAGYENCQVGIESTVLLVREDRQISILRRGGVLKSEIDQVLNKNKIQFSWFEATDKKEAPGHMKHHYMPSIPFVVCRNPQMKLSELGQILNDKLSSLPDEVEGVRIVKPKWRIEKIEFLKF